MLPWKPTLLGATWNSASRMNPDKGKGGGVRLVSCGLDPISGLLKHCKTRVSSLFPRGGDRDSSPRLPLPEEQLLCQLVPGESR